nr:Fur family transcriptional regulator [Alkaliphilus metalliredigens]
MRSEGEEMENLMDSLKERLKERGYKLTPQRRATLDIIMQTQGKHLNTEEIYDLVKEKCPEIGLATVYRTLQLLDDMNVISKLNLDDGCIRYELNTHEDDHQHHHLICQSCGTIIEVDIDLLDHLEAEIEKCYNFVIKDHKVKFFGICSKCD